MNKEIAKLLEKFGTTSEYLWEVLVTQAPIQGSIILFQLIVIILIGFGILKVHKKIT